MRLFLLRHGIAISREDPECPPDGERFLTPKGIRRTRAAAEGLQRLGVRPDLLLTSPLVRAEQTAAIAAQILGLRSKTPERTDLLLPEAEPQGILALVASRNRDALCVGHAPNLDLVLAAALGMEGPLPVALKKAGAACLEREGAGMRLVWYLDPKTLRMLRHTAGESED